jgi:glyoxylase-like metal-dependent hydrolase (beta-lactamase superfamily II)
MKLTFLGTGGAFTDFRVNYHNNALVHTAAGAVLIDCGATGVQSLKELGIAPWDLAGVLVTHCHGDHINGIEQLIWERFYTGPTGAPGWLPTPIWSTPEIMEGVRQALLPCIGQYTDLQGTRSDGWTRLVDAIEDRHGVTVGGVRFDYLTSRHVPGKPSFGVRSYREDADRNAPHGFFFSSDSIFEEAVFRTHPLAKLIFHDCTFSQPYPGTVHTHYAQLKGCVTWSEQDRARMVLMHHTVVPDHEDPVGDGFAGAASKHQTFVL